MAHPKFGMHYEDVRHKLRTYKTAQQNPNMRQSLYEQVRASNGDEAVKELMNEMDTDNVFPDTNNHSGSTVGSSPRYVNKYTNINWGK